MPKVNEPQRVVMRGRTRTIGEPRRPIEASGTVRDRPAPSTLERRVGEPRTAPPITNERGTSRAVVGEPKAVDPRTDPTRPLARIDRLETGLAELAAAVDELRASVAELAAVLNGTEGADDSAPVAERGVLPVLELAEQAVAMLAESVGELQQATRGSDTLPPPGEEPAYFASGEEPVCGAAFVAAGLVGLNCKRAALHDGDHATVHEGKLVQGFDDAREVPA